MGSYTYRGRQRDSYTPLDCAELIELQARMWTFDQAYMCTALMNLGYSMFIIKPFDHHFHHSARGLSITRGKVDTNSLF